MYNEKRIQLSLIQLLETTQLTLNNYIIFVSVLLPSVYWYCTAGLNLKLHKKPLCKKVRSKEHIGVSAFLL